MIKVTGKTREWHRKRRKRNFSYCHLVILKLLSTYLILGMIFKLMVKIILCACSRALHWSDITT